MSEDQAPVKVPVLRLLGHEQAVRSEWPLAVRAQLGIMRDSPAIMSGVVQDCPYLTAIWCQDALAREGLLHA